MFGHFVERMLMKGGGSSGSGGGGGPGRDTPGSPNAADGRRGSSMGPSGGSARGGGGRSSHPGRPGGESGERSMGPSSSSRGGGGDNDRVASTNPGRPGGESGERSLTVGESISGSGDARSNFSFSARNSAPTMSTFRDSRSTISPSTTGTFRAARELSRSTRRSNVASMEPLDRTTLGYGMIVGDGELSKEEQAREDRARDFANTPPREIVATRVIGDEMTQEAFDNRARMPFGIVGGALAAARNYSMAGKLQSDLESLEESRNMPDSTFDGTRGEIAMGLNADSLNETFGGFLGDGLSAREAIIGNQGAPSESSTNARQLGGGGSDQPFIPPQPVGPPASQATGTKEREPRIGQLGEYSSYARRVFSRI